MMIIWNPSLWGELAKSAVVSALVIGCATNLPVDNPHICHTSKYGEDAIILYKMNQYILCHSTQLSIVKLYLCSMPFYFVFMTHV
ncbi:hypothetical protein BKA82DRAFT_4155737, partial [Pisolithus tinctorius]